MLNYIIIFTALFSTLLFLIACLADIINSKNLYLKKDEENEITRAKYKIVLAFIMSLSWSFILI